MNLFLALIPAMLALLANMVRSARDRGSLQPEVAQEIAKQATALIKATEAVQEDPGGERQPAQKLSDDKHENN